MNFFVCLLVTVSLLISGCGGGSSSSPPNQLLPQSDTPSSSSDDLTNPPSSNLANLVQINPLRDLGLDKGELVCFRIKSYNNLTESRFSGAICNQIKNNKIFTLSWNTVPGDVVGYYVYYGTEKNNVNTFLKDVIES